MLSRARDMFKSKEKPVVNLKEEMGVIENSFLILEKSSHLFRKESDHVEERSDDVQVVMKHEDFTWIDSIVEMFFPKGVAEAGKFVGNLIAKLNAIGRTDLSIAMNQLSNDIGKNVYAIFGNGKVSLAIMEMSPEIRMAAATTIVESIKAVIGAELFTAAEAKHKFGAKKPATSSKKQ